MKLSRCILTLGACTGLILGLSLGSARSAKADCGDGVTTAGEACDAGTPLCQAGSKNSGAECHKDADCGGTPGSCGCAAVGGVTPSCNNGVGNRDDVPNACRSNCMPPMCGDGVADTLFGEQCDNGANNGSTKPCLGNAPNTVCKNGAGLCHGGGGNAAALISCTSDGTCAAACGGTCTGNPACQNAACGDGLVCSDPTCSSGNTSLISPSPGLPGPEACDDGNTSSMDSCTAFGFHAAVAGQSVPDQCQLNICGDGTTNMGVEQCDAGAAVCISGSKLGKPCCTDSDCTVANVAGLCSGAGGPTNISGFDNRNIPDQATTTGNTTCRCNCLLPTCGDGISDTGDGEECDDGTTANGPGKFCEHVRFCQGGENPGPFTCSAGSANAGASCVKPSDCPGGTCSRAATTDCASLCASDADCVKGHCGALQCIQNKCGDCIVEGNELCDDGDTTGGAPGDACGVTTLEGIAVNSFLNPGCNTPASEGIGGTGLENVPGTCISAGCILPFCGDGITQPGEMCDGGTAVCLPPALNAGSACKKASDCKPALGEVPGTLDHCSPVNPLNPTELANRDDLPNHCRSTCMPPSCGDGVSDSFDQCEPPASGTFCIKNAAGQCVLNTCGDDDVCNKSATDACALGGQCIIPGNPGPPVPIVCTSAAARAACLAVGSGANCCASAAHTCTTGPGGGPEQCDDSNTVDPTATNSDTCFSSTTTSSVPVNGVLVNAHCAAAGCGDGITENNEQCDSTTMGCSNMAELAAHLPVTCCFDGNVVDHSKLGPGLISVEEAFTALIGCRMPDLIGAAACDARLAKSLLKIDQRILSAQVYLENNDITRARRIMRSVSLRFNSITSRVNRSTKPGGVCAAARTLISEEKQDASNLAIGIVAHLTDDGSPFGP